MSTKKELVEHNKHVRLVSPISRQKRKSHISSRFSSTYTSVSPKSNRSKGVSWGGKHILLGDPKRRRNSMKVSRSILKPKKSYRNVISYSPKKYKSRRKIIIDTKIRSPSPNKESYVDTLSHITGGTKKFYSEWTKSELKERLHSMEYENWSPIHGKHVWSPRKRRSRKRSPSKRKSRKRLQSNRRSPSKKRSRKRSPSKRKSRKRSPSKRRSRKRSPSKRRSRKRSPSKRRSTSKVGCKSYQKRNENGRCVNNECKDGKIRDRITKKCRHKKN
jgi:hypothetical protein